MRSQTVENAVEAASTFSRARAAKAGRGSRLTARPDDERPPQRDTPWAWCYAAAGEKRYVTPVSRSEAGCLAGHSSPDDPAARARLVDVVCAGMLRATPGAPPAGVV